jgi:carbon-monoxide dehydrogenase large subunit
MDYLIPRADDLPEFSIVLNDVPTAENPLGVKGAGEGPTTGSPPAMMNAILDALAPRGITALEMPVTPERIWGALRRGARSE